MRRFFAIAVVAAVFLSLLPGALAKGTDTEEEAPTLASFTLEDARTLISYYGWEGVDGAIAQAGIRFWRPAAMERLDLTQLSNTNGCIAAFAAPDCTLMVTPVDYGIDFKEYQQAVQDSGFDNIRFETVNGVDFVLYDEPQKDGSFCRVAATQAPEQKILEYVFFFQDEAWDLLIDTVIATVRPAET